MVVGGGQVTRLRLPLSAGQELRDRVEAFPVELPLTNELKVGGVCDMKYEEYSEPL